MQSEHRLGMSSRKLIDGGLAIVATPGFSVAQLHVGK